MNMNGEWAPICHNVREHKAGHSNPKGKYVDWYTTFMYAKAGTGMDMDM